MNLKIRPFFDQNFNHFLASIFGRFLVVWGRQLGVIFGPFGCQDGPRSVPNVSCELINIKNVNFHQILRPLVPERYFGAQDGLPNAPRSAQDGSKRLLKNNFFGRENRLKFGLVLAPIWVEFGSRKASLEAPFWRPKSV